MYCRVTQLITTKKLTLHFNAAINGADKVTACVVLKVKVQMAALKFQLQSKVNIIAAILLHVSQLVHLYVPKRVDALRLACVVNFDSKYKVCQGTAPLAGGVAHFSLNWRYVIWV